ncbi:hypothetical protein R83H12_00423 [Fibrobacteria bacterium R8-3-H12]
MADAATTTEIETVRVSGPYRKIRAKIQDILLHRENKDFLVIEHVDKSDMVKRYAGFTDIMNFLHKLETVLIPIEDAENSSRNYGPVDIFKGSRF